jgi:nitrite reductase/ring-hydroxylating ferredoxin subunit
VKFRVARRSELPPGECKVVEAAGKQLALYNVDGTFYCTDNECRHRGGPLGDGILQGHTIICPLHYWKYDVRTGQQDMSDSIRLGCYTVSVDGDDVFVDV